MKLDAVTETLLEDADGLVFDMDGTLIDSMPLHFQAWTEVAKSHGLTLSRERFYQLGGVPTYETLVILAEEAGVEIDLIAAKHQKESLYQALLPSVTVINETLSIVEQYYGEKPMAIATGASQANARKVLGKLGIEHFFEAIVTSDDVMNHKPAPDVFLLAAERIDCVPAHCVAFEDTDIGIEAIESAKMTPIDIRQLLSTND
jgi:beta-phosphoglucomutase family hydrolase